MASVPGQAVSKKTKKRDADQAGLGFGGTGHDGGLLLDGAAGLGHDDDEAAEETAAAELKLVYRAEEKLINDFVENMCTEEQRERWYAFRKIKFPHAVIRKLAGQITGSASLPKSLPLVVSAVSRTYLSQVLDLSRQAMIDMGDDPKAPMAPHHLREGYRRFHAQGGGLPPRTKKRMF